MPDIKKVIDNPDTSSPRRTDRELDLDNWDEAQGQRSAEQEGIELTAEQCTACVNTTWNMGHPRVVAS